MKKSCYDENISLIGSAQDTIQHLTDIAEKARADGWTGLEFYYGECGLDLWGHKPPDAEKLAKAKEKRRLQYEKLKKEFGE